MISKTAHIFVVSKEEEAYFELVFENEETPELVVDEVTFVREFERSNDRMTMISSAFDSNYGWEDEPPHSLIDEINDYHRDSQTLEDFKQFSKTVEKMNNIEYVLFAVDSDTEDWGDYPTYWYDAKVFDFLKTRRITVEWRGTQESFKAEKLIQDPFTEETAKNLIKSISKERTDQIDLGNFMLKGVPQGRIQEKILQGPSEAERIAIMEARDKATKEQIERITDLITIVDDIVFDGKAFVFDSLESITVGDEYIGSDSPNHPIIKSVIEAGGLLRRAVSGKTDYLVINTHAYMSGAGTKCRDALIQVDKGKNIKIITLENLMDILGKK